MGLTASGSGGGNPAFAGGAGGKPYNYNGEYDNVPGGYGPNSGLKSLTANGAGAGNSRSWGDPNQTSFGSPYYNDQAQVSDGNGNNLPQYGGARGQANVTAGHFGALADAANARQNFSYDNAAAFQSQKDQQNARNLQMQGLNMTQQAAMGNTPSIAQLQMGQGINNSIAAQMAMANSTRGGGGNIALAQRNAAGMGQQMRMQGVNQSAMLRAQEMAQARDAYSQQAGAMRAGDLNAIGANNTVGVDAAKHALATQVANDQTAQGWAGLGNQVTMAQLGADTSALGAETGVGIANGQLGLAQSNSDWQHASQIAAAVGGGLALFA